MNWRFRMRDRGRAFSLCAWCAAGLYVLVLSYFTLAPDPWWFMGEWGRETEESLDSTFADYLQHFGAYLMLSLLVVGASLTTLRPSALICGIAAVLHGIATEALQHFIPRRTCDWTDALANAGGAFIGWLLIDRLEFILQKTARRKRRA